MASCPRPALTRSRAGRWHEQDPDELMASCDVCIAEACKALEVAGYSKESVKVIGAPHHSQPKPRAD